MQWSRDSHAHRFSDTCWPCTPVGPETQVHRPLGRDSLRKCIGTKAYGSTQTFAHTSLGMLKWTCQIGKGRHVCTGRNAQTSVRARMYEAPQGKTYPNTRVPPLEKVFFFFFQQKRCKSGYQNMVASRPSCPWGHVGHVQRSHGEATHGESEGSCSPEL